MKILRAATAPEQEKCHRFQLNGYMAALSWPIARAFAKPHRVRPRSLKQEWLAANARGAIRARQQCPFAVAGDGLRPMRP